MTKDIDVNVKTNLYRSLEDTLRSNADNINLYQKFGFHVIHEFTFHEVQTFSMIREAK